MQVNTTDYWARKKPSQAFTSKHYLVKDELLDLLAVYNGKEVRGTQVLPFSKQSAPYLIRNYLCVRLEHTFQNKMFKLIKLHGSLEEGR